MVVSGGCQNGWEFDNYDSEEESSKSVTILSVNGVRDVSGLFLVDDQTFSQLGVFFFLSPTVPTLLSGDHGSQIQRL